MTGMTVLQAAVEILQEAEEPLHYAEITKRLLAKGWKTRAKRPESTVFGSISNDIKKWSDRSRFRLVGDGVIGLKASRPTLVSERKNRRIPKTDPLEPAERILRAAGEPMHCRDLAKRMLDEGSWATNSRHASLIVAASIRDDIKQHAERSRFRAEGYQVFALNNAGSAPPSRDPLTLLRAAEEVLQAAGEPLHYRELAKRMLVQGLWNTKSPSPAAIVNAAIGHEIRGREETGAPQKFVRPSPGFIALAEKRPAQAPGASDAENRRLREELLQRLPDMDPAEFERLIGDLFAALGIEEVTVTRSSRDEGICFRGTLVVGGAIRVKLAAQVRRSKGSIDAPVVQQLRGSLGMHEQGLIVTTGTFAPAASEAASHRDASPVGLIDNEGLASLLVKHEIGVER